MAEPALELESPRILRILKRRLQHDRHLRRNSHDLEDAVQTTLLRAARGWKRRRDRSLLATESWCATISDRVAIDGATRRARRRVQTEAGVEVAASDNEPSEVAAQREAVARMRAAAGRLGELSRVVFEILIVEHLEPRELGMLLGVDPDVARMRRNRMYDELRSMLERMPALVDQDGNPIRTAERRRSIARNS